MISRIPSALILESNKNYIPFAPMIFPTFPPYITTTNYTRTYVLHISFKPHNNPKSWALLMFPSNKMEAEKG